MRASQVLAVALVDVALLTAIGVHAWSNTSDAPSVGQANAQGILSGEGQVPAAPFAPTPVAPPTPTPATATVAPMPPPAPVSSQSAPVDSAEPAAADASLEVRRAEAASAAAHRTERYLHSRRDDGQHAE